jgi:hypothetical protein
MKKFGILDGQWGEEFQKGFEEYMESLYNSVDAEGEESDVTTESGEIFCACNVCEVREILFYVTPRVIQAFLDEKIELYKVEPKES